MRITESRLKRIIRNVILENAPSEDATNIQRRMDKEAEANTITSSEMRRAHNQQAENMQSDVAICANALVDHFKIDGSAETVNTTPRTVYMHAIMSVTGGREGSQERKKKSRKYLANRTSEVCHNYIKKQAFWEEVLAQFESKTNVDEDLKKHMYEKFAPSWYKPEALQMSESRLRRVIRRVILENMESYEEPASSSVSLSGPINQEELAKITMKIDEFDMVADMMVAEFPIHFGLEHERQNSLAEAKAIAYGQIDKLKEKLEEIPKEHVDDPFLEDYNFRGILQSFIDNVSITLSEPNAPGTYKSKLQEEYSKHRANTKKYIELCMAGKNAYDRADAYEKWISGSGM